MKMMFTGEDRQALQTLIGNGTITPQIQQTPKLIFNHIQTTIKEDKHFWNYHDELVSDLCQTVYNLLTTVNFPTVKQRKHSKSSS